MKYFKFFILIICGFTAAGQNKITGKITDATTGQPVDYATISLYKAGATSPVNGTVSDVKGNFTINKVPRGTYKVTVDFMGYQRYTIDQVVVSNNMTLKAIALLPVQTQLQGVTVVGKAPMVENKIDKMVYNAANDLTAQGGVAIDLLKKVPQVSVDIDGNVELQGNASVRFLINGARIIPKE